LNVAGSTIAFSTDYIPTALRADVAGKLVKCFVPDGAQKMDVFFPLLKKVSSSKEDVGLLELYARCLYRTCTIKEIER
jgi:hypothetical protein